MPWSAWPRERPRSDGFTSEFYCKFWDLVGPDLVEVLNSCYFRGSLSLSQRRDVISLLFKKRGQAGPSQLAPDLSFKRRLQYCVPRHRGLPS